LFPSPFFFFYQCTRAPPQWNRASSLSRIHDHTQTHHNRCDSSGRVISSLQRPLPDDTQHSQETDIYAPREVRTHNPSKRATADQCRRPRGHWDRPPKSIRVMTLRKIKTDGALVTGNAFTVRRPSVVYGRKAVRVYGKE
jgi:hypothetical protein